MSKMSNKKEAKTTVMKGNKENKEIKQKKEKKENPQKQDFYTPTDRIFVISTQFDEFVATYPSIRADKELKKKVKKVSNLLGELYQEMGAKIV